jgi:L-lactate dehydrogenase (cytochrome)
MFKTLRSAVRFRRFRLGRTTRQLERAANIADLRVMAKQRLPGGVFDYIDGGAEDERTLARNANAYTDYEFVPRVLRDVSTIDTSTMLLGKEISFPFVLAPTGFTRIAHSQGELAVARAGQRAGIPYTLSTLGTRSIEEVAEVNTTSKWFQVYVWKDRGLVTEMIDRAAASGYETLCITVDLAVFGRRERDVRRGFTLPPKVGLDTIVDAVRRPSWTADFLRGGPIRFASVATRNSDGNIGDGAEAVSLAEFTTAQLDASLSWSDLEQFRDQWDGPIVIKGIQCVEDALIAADLGMNGLALSNHGGRQLEGSPAPVALLPHVAEVVGDRVELICDGGIRRGSDIVKAVALGATAAMGGRAYLYGLGAAGERGVDTAIGFLRSEYERCLALNGITSTADIHPSMVTPAAGRTATFT